jgi:hypothetical protein
MRVPVVICGMISLFLGVSSVKMLFSLIFLGEDEYDLIT